MTMQQSVVHLSDKIRANGTSAADQVLLATAISELMKGATLEQAVVAVAERHLNTATSGLNQAKAAVDGAAVLLNKNAHATSLLPEIRRNTKANHFTLLEIPNISLERNHSAHTYYAYNPATVRSFEDYNTGQFYVYYDYGDKTGQEALKARIVKISADGKVEHAATTSRFINYGVPFAYVPVDGGVCRIIAIEGSAIKLMKELEFSYEHSSSIDYNTVYQDFNSLKLYFVAGGKIKSLSSKGISSEPDTAVADQAAFDAWAKGKNYRLVNFSSAYRYSHAPGTIQSDDSYSSHSESLPVDFSYYKTHEIFTTEKKIVTPAISCAGLQATDTQLRSGQDKTYPRVKRWEGLLNFSDLEHRNNVAKIELLCPQHSGSGNTFYYARPCIIAFSRQHRAMVYNIGMLLGNKRHIQGIQFAI